MDQCLPALSCCLDEKSSSERKSSLAVCLKTIGARDMVPLGEEVEEDSSKLAYRVRPALGGLLEASNAILRWGGMTTVLGVVVTGMFI